MADSVATATDKHSRPLKRRALSPSSKHSASVTALFANPPPLPPSSALVSSSSSNRDLPAPPEIVSNVQGSSAGAGSGEFHVYKASRRREYERLARMDEESRELDEAGRWEKEKEEKRRRDEERTEKNRAKRRGKGKAKDKDGKGKSPASLTGNGVKGGLAANAAGVANGTDGKGEEEGVDAPVVEEQGITFADED